MNSKEALTERLRPENFTAMSGKMAALVGYVLDERFTEPAIAELVITSDPIPLVLARIEGDSGANDIIGTEEDVVKNFARLAAAAELDADEAGLLGFLMAMKLSGIDPRPFYEGGNPADRVVG